MIQPQNNRKAVVLSGGGAHGAYEVGILKALLKGESPATNFTPLDPDVVTGTSIGACNAAGLVSRLEIEGPPAVADFMEHLWTEVIPRDGTTAHNHIYRFRGNPEELLHPTAFVRNPAQSSLSLVDDAAFLAQDWFARGRTYLSSFFSPSAGPFSQRTLELLDLSTFISREPTERLLRDVIQFDNILRSQRLLIVAATNWKIGDVELFVNRPLPDMTGLQLITPETGVPILLASSAVPGVFPAVTIDNNVYVDGGLLLNTPLGPAFIQGDVDTAHVVYLDPEAKDIPLKPLNSTIDVLDRFTVLTLAKSMNSDVEIANRVNQGLAIIDQAGRPEQQQLDVHQDARQFAEALGWVAQGIKGVVPTRPKTIHRYRPAHDLGGTMSLLNFERDVMIAVIDQGYHDALNHDCKAQHCILPVGGTNGTM